MRAAIGLVDDLIERVEDYEIPKVVATVSTTNPTDQSTTGSSSQSARAGAPTAANTMSSNRNGNSVENASSNVPRPDSRGSATRSATVDAYRATGSDAQLLLRFYSRVEPGFSTEEKVAQASNGSHALWIWLLCSSS